MAGVYTEHDKMVAREVHKLFWRANMVDKLDFVLWALMRPAAIFITGVLIPFVVAYGLQAIIVRDFGAVNKYALWAFLLGIMYVILWGLGGVVICRNGKIGTEYIQKEVFANYLSKDYEFFNSTYVGSLGAQAQRLRHNFNEYCTLVMNGVVRQIVIIVTSIVIIAWQSFVLALATVVLMALVLSFTIISSRWRLKYRRILSEADSETAGVIGDALSHGTTVKSFAAEAYEKTRLNSALGKLVDAQYWSWMTSIPADLGRMLLSVVATAILLLMTAHLYESGKISIAIVVLVQLYVIKLIVSTYDIAELIKTYEAVMSGAHQAVKTMLVQPTILDKKNPSKFPKKRALTIALDAVSYRYDDAPADIFSVKAFSLEIKQGEKIGLVGYSGSGKTTLTKLLLRFMDITDGSIKVGDLDIRNVTQNDLRKHIAYVPQEPLLFHRSIAENIAYGKPSSRAKAIRAAGKAAYVDEFVGELAKGYDTLVGEKGVKLSGGQRQRVAIARALLKDAPILVLDEATSALDSRSEQYIQKALWKLMNGRTAIVIAHRLSTIQRMDRIVVMDKGHIVDIGTHEQLLKRSNSIYAKLWAHQSGGYIGASNSGK